MIDLIWIVAIIVFAVWWYVLADLDKAGILKKYNMTAIGPIIMIRTFRGQKLLDWVAHFKKFWHGYTTLGMPIVIASMILMLVTLLLADFWMLSSVQNIPDPGPANAPQNILAIPGLNQFIPFWWGWVALIIAMMVHEFGHAILAKVEGIKVNSLGLMLMPVPIGAFAEIDEEEMFGTKSEGASADIIGPMDTKLAGEGKRKASTKQFVNILSAGVISNFFVALVAFILLFGPVLGAIAASDNDVVVYDVAAGSPAAQAGITPNLIVLSVDGKPITNTSQFDGYLRSAAGANVTIAGTLSGKPESYTVPSGNASGVYIIEVVNDSTLPAKAAGVEPNMRLTAINGTAIDSPAALTEYMNHTSPGQGATLSLTYLNGTQKNLTVILGQGTGKKGQIGIISSNNPIGITTGEFGQGYLTGLRNMPFSLAGGLRLFLLPLLQFTGSDPGFSIFTGEYASLYHTVGWAAPFGTSVYSLAEGLFWIGWLNFNVGLFNCLPMIPLDGGHIFREVTRSFMSRFIKDQEKAERISKAIVNTFAVTLLASIIFMFVAPYFAQWFLR